jgi:hypothetical protein
VHVISPPGRLSVPNVCACTAFAVSRLRSQFARPAKDTAIVGLPFDHSAKECLPNGECSRPPGVTLSISQLSSTTWPSSRWCRGADSNLRCIMGMGLKADGVTSASQGAMLCQQGQETRSAVERIAAFAVAARPERLTDPCASIRAMSTSKARPPIWNGRPSARNSRRCSDTWKRPKLTLAGVSEPVSIDLPI